jgi:opacity protein-like surface antigen
MKKIIILALIAIFGITGVSYAGIQAGKGELGIAAAYTMPDEGDTDSYTAMSSLGYFVTNQIQLGVGLIVSGTTGDNDSRVLAGLGQVKYHFNYAKDQTVVPFLGIQGGLYNISYKSSEYDDDAGEVVDKDKSETAFSYGGMGGVKFFVTENTSLNTEVNYQRVKIDESDSGTLTFLIGLSFYF